MDLAEGLAPWWSHDATAPLAAATPEPLLLVQVLEILPHAACGHWVFVGRAICATQGWVMQ